MLAKTLGLIGALIPLVAAAPLAGNQNAIRREIIPGKYIVTFNEGVDIESHRSWVEGVHKRNKAKRDDGSTGLQTFYHLFPSYAGEFDDATIEEIRASPDVKDVEEDQVFRLYETSSLQERAIVTQTEATYNLGSLSHREPGSTEYVYDDSASGADTFAYIVDTGINAEHVEFEGRAVQGYNAAGGADTDENGHGTHVAGSVGGATYGVVKKTNLIAVKVFGAGDTTSTSIILLGLDWAQQDILWRERASRSVVNMSLGGGKSAAMDAGVKAMVDAGITVVVAAGNELQDANNVSPANVPQVITVGSVDRNNAKAFDSNFGTALDVFAAGVATLSAYIGSTTATRELSGTSMASPHVAGLALYLMQLEGLSAPADVAARIIELATPDVVTDVNGSPNRLAYNGNGA